MNMTSAMTEMLTQYLHYHMWANQRLFEVLDALTPEEYRLDLGGSYGSIQGTAIHLYGTEYIWLSRIDGHSPDRLFDEQDYPDWPQLKKDWMAGFEQIEALIQKLDEKMAVEKVTYHTTTGKKYSQPTWELIVHMVNHGSYHRGQIINMVRQLETRRHHSSIRHEQRFNIQPMDFMVYCRQ